MKCLSRFAILVVAFWMDSGQLLALLGGTPTIRAVAIARNPVVTTKGDEIMIGQAADGSYHLIVRQIEKATGFATTPDLVVAMPDGVTPVDVTFSTILRPGSILVLAGDLRVLEWGLAFDADGKPKLVGSTPTIHGPFGDPRAVGAAMVFAEAPNAADPEEPFLAIGTSAGIVVVGACPFVEPETAIVNLGKGAITGLAAVPQVGDFVFAAIAAGRLVGVDPDSSAGTLGPQPSVIFELADPRPHSLIDLSGAVFEPNDEPLSEPQPVSIVAANGTTQVAMLEIPAAPSFATELKLGIVVVGTCPIVRLDVGSLVMLDADGDAVFYDPEFTLAHGFGDTVFTIFGSTVQIEPETINLKSKGQWVTVVIEVANGAAAEIDRATPVLSAGGSSVAAWTDFTPQLSDEDGDGNADLTLKFERAAVQAMLDAALPASLDEGNVIIEATWTFSDSSTGTASAQVRVMR